MIVLKHEQQTTYGSVSVCQEPVIFFISPLDLLKHYSSGTNVRYIFLADLDALHSAVQYVLCKRKLNCGVCLPKMSYLF